MMNSVFNIFFGSGINRAFFRNKLRNKYGKIIISSSLIIIFRGVHKP